MDEYELYVCARAINDERWDDRRQMSLGEYGVWSGAYASRAEGVGIYIGGQQRESSSRRVAHDAHGRSRERGRLFLLFCNFCVR